MGSLSFFSWTIWGHYCVRILQASTLVQPKRTHYGADSQPVVTHYGTAEDEKISPEQKEKASTTSEEARSLPEVLTRSITLVSLLLYG